MPLILIRFARDMRFMRERKGSAAGSGRGAGDAQLRAAQRRERVERGQECQPTYAPSPSSFCLHIQSGHFLHFFSNCYYS